MLKTSDIGREGSKKGENCLCLKMDTQSNCYGPPTHLVSKIAFGLTQTLFAYVIFECSFSNVDILWPPIPVNVGCE